MSQESQWVKIRKEAEQKQKDEQARQERFQQMKDTMENNGGLNDGQSNKGETLAERLKRAGIE